MSNKTVKQMREDYKAAVLKELAMDFYSGGNDPGLCGSNEFNVPIVLPDGTEDWLVIKVSIPNGPRDGSGYDGYAARDEYKHECEVRAVKQQKAAENKAKRIAAAQKTAKESSK